MSATSQRHRRVGLVAGALVVIVGVLAPVGAPAGAASVASSRLEGADRFETAANIAAAKFPAGVSTVVLASGLSYADALAGAYLAGLGGVQGATGPAGILLTLPDAIPASVSAALRSLKVKNVVILGGPSAVSPAVESQLATTASTASAGGTLNVTRLAGTNRYDTMAAIDAVFGPGSVGAIGAKKTAVVASGANFPDSLAAAGAAYKAHLPIVLTTPDHLIDQAAHTLSSLGIQQVLIMGGTAAIQGAVNSAVQGVGISVVQQFSGVDRTDTAVQFAAYETATLGFSNHEVVVTRGDAFADALAGSQYVGDPKTLVLLENSNLTSVFDSAYLAAHRDEIAIVTALGGPNGVSPAALSTVIAASQGFTVTSVTPATLPNDGHSHAIVVRGTGFTVGVNPRVGLGPSASNTNPATGPCTDARGNVPGITANIVSDTEIDAAQTLPAGCPPGPYSLFLTHDDGGQTLLVDCFACITATGGLTVTSITPTGVPNDGSASAVVIAGNGFTPASTASISPSTANSHAATGPCFAAGASSLDVTALAHASATELDGTVTIPPGCPSGGWDVVVDNTATSGGSFAACQGCLNVGVASISPSTIRPDAMDHRVVISGGGFRSASSVFVSPSVANHTAPSGACGDSTNTVAVTGLTHVNGTEIDGTLNLPTGCPSGVWDIEVDNTPGGGQVLVCQQCLTVGSNGTVRVKVVTVSSCTDSGSSTELPGATVTIGGVSVTTGSTGSNSDSLADVPAGMDLMHGNGTVLSFQVTAEASGVSSHLVGNDQTFDFAATSGSTPGTPDYSVAVRFQAGC